MEWFLIKKFIDTKLATCLFWAPDYLDEQLINFLWDLVSLYLKVLSKWPASLPSSLFVWLSNFVLVSNFTAFRLNQLSVKSSKNFDLVCCLMSPNILRSSCWSIILSNRTIHCIGDDFILTVFVSDYFSVITTYCTSSILQ